MGVKIKSLAGVQTSEMGALHSNLLYQLKNDILSEKFKRGEKLTEQVICNKYSVSRTPVREAFFQLESEGLLEIIPNRGAFVIGLSPQDRDDIHILRGIYEVQATRWAIERITPDELDLLGETFEFMEFYTMKKDLVKMLTINSTFHKTIYSASHNRLLKQVLTLFQAYVATPSNSPRDTEDLAIILEEHRKIYEAFISKDAVKGAKAMEEHIKNSTLRKSKQL